MAEAGLGIHGVAVIRAGLMGSAIAAHIANAGLPGSSARAAFEMAVEGFALADTATAHDRVVGRALSEVVSGGRRTSPRRSARRR